MTFTRPKLALAFLAVLIALSVHGQGFVEPKKQVVTKPRWRSEAYAVTGETYTFMFGRSGCSHDGFLPTQFRDTPHRGQGVRLYEAKTPQSFTVLRKVDTPIGYILEVRMQDGALAYVDMSEMRIVQPRTPSEMDGGCTFAMTPEELPLRRAELVAEQDRLVAAIVRRQMEAEAPARALEEAKYARRRVLPRIGMTLSQVGKLKAWSNPKSVNVTVIASGRGEQWVFEGGDYLYFENGRVSGIQMSDE